MAVIDTIKVFFPHKFYSPSEAWREKYNSFSGEIESYYFNGGDVRLTLRENPPFLFAETSLPKLLWDNNIGVMTMQEFRESCHRLSEAVSEAVPGEIPPMTDWRLSRVDWYYNWQVSNPHEYILSIRSALDQTARQEVRCRHDRNRGGATLERFAGQSWREMLYNKAAEVKAYCRKHDVDEQKALDFERMAEGILRFEVMLERKALVRHFGEHATLGDLMKELENDGMGFVRMKWDEFAKNWKPMGEDAARSRLIDYYKDKLAIAKRLYGVWLGINSMGLSDYVVVFGVSRDTLTRDIKDIKAAGVSLGSGNELKPLSIGA